MRFGVFINCTVSAAALGFALPAMAQSSDTSSSRPLNQTQNNANPQTDNSADIVVTAEKRAERVQDVPLSISVASQEQLERQQVNTVADLSRVAPSLEIQQAPGQSVGGGGQIRGIGTQSFQTGAVGSVGIVVDQVSQGNVNISDLFDIARVEVLKGPQGTLFGLTTSAGVINITTNAPDFHRFEVRARTELSRDGTAGSEYGQQIAQGLVNIPLADNAAVRVSGNLNLRQGVDRNLFSGKLDTADAWSVRGRFRWEPTSRLTVNLIGDFSQFANHGEDFFTILKATPGLAAELANCGIVASASNRNYCSNDPVYTKTKTYGGSAQIDYDAGPLTLTSITSYRRQDSAPGLGSITRLDVDPLRIVSTVGKNTNRLFTEEFRIASPSGSTIEYTAGMFLSSQRGQNPPGLFNIIIHVPYPGPNIVLARPVSTLGSLVNINDDSLAFFGQTTIHLGDHLRLIGGARYTGERLSADTTPVGLTVTGRGTVNIDNFSWKAGAQYEFNSRLQAFATVSRGYKGPQLVLPDPSVPGSVATIIRPEVPTDYEAGLKATFAGGRLATDLSAFWIDLRDYQGQQCVPLAGGLGLRCVPQNISKVKSRGVEFNIFGQPVHALSLNAGIIYNPVTYPVGFAADDLYPYGTTAAPAGLGNLQLQGAPRWKFTASGEFSQPVGGRLEAFLAADAIHKSSIRAAASVDPTLVYGANWTLGGRIGLRDASGRWTAAIFARNLGANREPVIRYASFPSNPGDYGQILTPQAFRQVGLSLDGRF